MNKNKTLNLKIKSENEIRKKQRKEMKKFAMNMTKKQAHEMLVGAGICTPKGNYTAFFK